MEDALPKIEDAIKIVIALLEEMGQDDNAFLETDGSVIVKKGERILSIYPDQTILKLYHVNGDPTKTDSISDLVDCTEINLYNPQSINILKEWIGKLNESDE